MSTGLWGVGKNKKPGGRSKSMIEIVDLPVGEVPANGNLKVVVNLDEVPYGANVTEIRLREIPPSEEAFLREIPENLPFYQTLRGGNPSNTYVTFIWVVYPDGTLPFFEQAMNRAIAEAIVKRYKIKRLTYRTAIERFISGKASSGAERITLSVDPLAWRENRRERWVVEVNDDVARLVIS